MPTRRQILAAVMSLPLLRLLRPAAGQEVRIGWAGNLSTQAPGFALPRDIVAATIEGRSRRIADCVSRDNALLVFLRRGHVTPMGRMLDERKRAFEKVVRTRRRDTRYAAWAERAHHEPVMVYEFTNAIDLSFLEA